MWGGIALVELPRYNSALRAYHFQGYNSHVLPAAASTEKVPPPQQSLVLIKTCCHCMEAAFVADHSMHSKPLLLWPGCTPADTHQPCSLSGREQHLNGGTEMYVPHRLGTDLRDNPCLLRPP